MRIVVLVKYVPQVDSDLRFTDSHTVLREPAAGTLNELDEHAIEAALQLAATEPGSEVIALAMAPEIGDLALRKAFQFGVDRGIRLTDDGLAGSDTFGTTAVLAAAIRKLGEQSPVQVVVAGMASSDAAGAVVPALLASDLGWPGLTFADAVSVADGGGALTVTRSIDDAVETLQAPLPVVLSVTDSANTVRTPNFKLIMAARAKPIETWTLADLDVDAATVGAAAARTVVVDTARVPDKPTPPVVLDDGSGSGAQALVDFLVEKELV